MSDVLVRAQTRWNYRSVNLPFIRTEGSVEFTSCQLNVLFALGCPLADPPHHFPAANRKSVVLSAVSSIGTAPQTGQGGGTALGNLRKLGCLSHR